MCTLSEAGPTSELTCVRDGWFSRDYDFLLDGELCGSLEWERGFWPRALAETGDSAWWIERRGLRDDHVMLVPGAAETAATYRRRSFRPSEIVFADGRTFQWHRVRAFSLRLRYGIRQGREDLLEFREEGSVWRPKVRIHMWTAAMRDTTADDRAILILLGTYLYFRLRTKQSWF